tara:strand:- start:1281 stop:2396 length:1116 start_codon:yes stop_codon:yes gene_type:complete
MAVYKIFPTKDATLYSQYKEMNTGLDEIIESSTFNIGTDVVPQTSRFLIQFDSNEITDIINNKISGATYTPYLRVYAANVTSLNTDSTLKIYPISESWDMGTGKYLDSPKKTNGCSWQFNTYSGSTYWQTASADFVTNTTASWSGSNEGGGTWYYVSSSTQTFSYKKGVDIKVDVKDIVTAWYNGNITNNGFIVKQTSSAEFIYNSAKSQTFKYFSTDTNTIYPPQLEFRWYDYLFSTGSSTNTIISDSDFYISFENNPGIYYSESIQRFKLNVRPQFPIRTFTTSSVYTKQYFLPESSSLYAVKDLDTNEYVIDFDPDYTRISANSNNSYFDIYMNGLQPERYYKILIKATVDSTTRVYDENLIFKVSSE